MEKLLNNKLENYSQEDKDKVFKFIELNTETLVVLCPKQAVSSILEESNIQVKPMESIQSKSNMLASLLVTKDKVVIKVNKKKIEKLCNVQDYDIKLITDKILLHEYLHYTAYKNNINLIYKVSKFKKLQITEEIIINRAVDKLINTKPSINDLYSID